MAGKDGRARRGVLFVITFVTSIPALLLYDPVLNHPGYILTDGADTRVLLGAFLELILIIANIGTAVVLFPILKRQNETLALGFVTARVIESTFIAVGILRLLAIPRRTPPYRSGCGLPDPYAGGAVDAGGAALDAG